MPMNEPPEEPEIFQFHCVKHPGNKTYLLIDDVVQFLREMAATEETDVRNRLEEAAANVLKLKGSQ
jgi:hypothetical protein